MTIIERFSVIFDKLNEQTETGDAVSVSYRYVHEQEEHDEIRRLAEIAAETKEVKYQFITTT